MNIVTIFETYLEYALAPFKAGRVSTQIEEDWSSMDLVIHLRFENLPSMPFRYEIPGRATNMLSQLELYDMVGRAAAEHYRQFYIPPSDNIVLGEN